MPKVEFTTRLDSRTYAAIEELCRARGLEVSRFVEAALVDNLEGHRDLEAIRSEPSRPLSEILADLGLDGSL